MADDLLASASRASAADQVLMPSGMEYRIEKTPVLEAVLRGALSGNAAAVAMSVENGDSDPAELAGQDKEDYEAARLALIVRSVREVRWTCKCGPEYKDCTGHRANARMRPFEWRPWSFTVDELAADPPPIGRTDLEVLRQLVGGFQTPRMVNAWSTGLHGLMDAAEAERIIAEERPKTITALLSFRHYQRGAEPRPDGEGVESSPEPLVPRSSANGGNRAGRRARAQTPRRRSA